MVAALQDPQAAPDVRSASPVVSGAQTLVYDGTDHAVPQFVGTYPAYVSASNYSIAEGSPFTTADVNSGRQVVLVGSTVAEALFPGINAVGKQITVGGTLFTVVGVLAEKGGAGFNDPNDIAIAPVSAVQQALKVPVTGVFGVQTLAAVQKFQSAHSLLASGIVNAPTWRALLKATR